MKISTRGRYSLRMTADILTHQQEVGFLSLSGISERQGISVKYLEQLVPPLLKAGILSASRGKTGGYRCDRDPKELTVLEILRLTDDLKPVACLKANAKPCPRRAECVTVGMWEDFANVIEQYFAGITMQDLLDHKINIS